MTRIPGLQRWAKEDNDLTSEAVSHPVAAHSKFPLPEKQKNYLGALIKVGKDQTKLTRRYTVMSRSGQQR